MTTSIKTAIFPVAGLGTRFLPATKATPKEMLPVIDKPLIQYAVDEAVNAGIENLVFITSYHKRAIEDHFDYSFELDTLLQAKQKKYLLEEIRQIIPEHVNCCYVRQKQALGLGHAILCAKALIKNEAFAVLLADDLLQSKENFLSKMIKTYQETGTSVLALQSVEKETVDQYGIVKLKNENNSHPLAIEHLVEKPTIDEAPSNLAIIGRYILSPVVLDTLEHTKSGSGGEIQLTDGIQQSLQHEALFGLQYEGARFDCGSKLGYLEANVALGLAHPKLGKDFSAILSRYAS